MPRIILTQMKDLVLITGVLSLLGCNTALTLPDSQVAYVVQDSVVDGDSFRVRYLENQTLGEEVRIRLCGIDAPERDQPFGQASRDYLKQLLGDRENPIAVVPIEQDRYGRTVAEVFVATGEGGEIFVNGEMVRVGMAYHYAQYSDTCPNRQAIRLGESMGKEERVGVFGEDGLTLPWEWRRQKRERGD
jgi:micrococcal nuclease